MNLSPKTLVRNYVNSINDIRICFMSTSKQSKKAPNHYETLNVARDSTQEDIKSAYYELSKKYHPDRNTSLDAKKNFQNVADAYEVLSNFNKRKLYDRDLLARGDRTTTTTTSATYRPGDFKEDPMSAFYRSHSVGGTYDFEAWNRAHYSHSLRRTIKDKQGRMQREYLRQKYKEDEQRNAVNARVILGTTTFILIMMYIQTQKERAEWDRNRIPQTNKK